MPSRPILALGALAALWGAGALLAGADDAPSSAPDPISAAAGADECARCHGDVHSAWQFSTHALTLQPAGELSLPAEVWAGGEVVHGPGRTRFERRDDGVWAHTLDATGAERAFPVTHVVGRTRIQMLVTRMPDGRQQVLPSMREKDAPVWFDYTALYFAGPGSDPRVPPLVAPGDPSFWTGPVRSWDAQCSRCHLSGRRAAEDPGTGPRVTQRALGLDCESCHGPSADHVEHYDRMLTGPNPMTRLDRLPRRTQVDVCLVCHMEAEELLPGWHARTDADLLEHLDPSLLDDPDRVDPAGRPLELVYAGVSFHMSRCAEEGRLTCTTCHDPHGGPQRGALRDSSPDAACIGCHAEIGANVRAHTHHDPSGPGGSCVSCHMPLLTVERGHGAVSDHTISVPRPHLAGPRVAQDACSWCHVGGRGAPAGAPALSQTEIRRRHAGWWPGAQVLPRWLDAIAGARAGAYDAPQRLDELLADSAAPRFARATAAVLLGQHSDAARERLLAHVADPDSLVRRRVASGLLHVQRPEAWDALGRLLDDPSLPVRVHAARTSLMRRSDLAGDGARWSRVQAELRADAERAPDDDRRWDWLGHGWALQGMRREELGARERQLQLDPDNAGLRRWVEYLRELLAR